MAVAFVAPLAALVLPIIMILTALVIDLLVVLWFAYRWMRDDVVPAAVHFMRVHFALPIARLAHSHRLQLRPR